MSSLKTLCAVSTAAFLVVGALACKKEGDFIPIQPELKAAFLFKVGSYWIYRDTLNQTLDSVYLERVDSTAHPVGDHPEDLAESQNQVFAAYRWNGSGHDFRSKQSVSMGGSGVYSFRYPFASSMNVTVTKHPAVSVQGNAFENVTEITGSKETFMVKEKIGAITIRRRLNDTQSYFYQLVRWSVSQ